LGDVVDSLSYLESAGEGQSFGRYDGFFAWSREQTLGEKNIFVSIDPPDDTLVKVREEISTFRENQSPKSTSVKKVSVAKKKTVQKVAGIKIKAGLKIALSQVREQDKGTLITTTGTVAVLPGILGTQYFYIVDDSAGVQIFMSKKDFPDIFVGDQLQITGQISESYGETRVNVQKKSQIEILGHGEMPLAQNVELANIGEPFEGALVQNTAQVTDVKSGYMYIDDGTGEIKVYFKRGSGITREDVMLGNTVVVTGIVSQMQGGYQILPRSKEDIVSLVSSTVVLGAKSDFVSSGRKEFVTVLFVAAILILFWTLLKTYKLKVTSK
jgi:DNA/RNA endonuclease YhcR with UshA esterase domain